MDFNKTYHFVGIKGSGMSSLALILFDKGYKVQGSDVSKYFFTQKNLEDNNIPIYEFSEDNIEEGQVIIAGNAFPDTHEEIVRANELGLEVIRYHKFLGDLSDQFKSVSVTGSHGKTSTTGMLAHVLGGIKNTSFLIGDGTGSGHKDAEYFVLEACEYRRHFMAYASDYAIMTNIDFDHPDYFTGIDDVTHAFESFAAQIKKAIFACGDDERLRNLKTDTKMIYYGFEDHNNVQARNIEKLTSGSEFDVYIDDELLDRFFIPTFGNHNIQNALGVIALTHYENVDLEGVKEQLKTYGGVKRRFTEKTVNDTVIIDDYAHHPAEIKATIDAARQKYPDRQIIGVFQPHTFTRTVALMDDFAKSLDLADHVFLCDIFHSAREQSGDVKIENLFDKLEKGRGILSEDDVSQLLDYGDSVYVFMGAGDVQKFEYAFEKLLTETTPTKQ